ncbi:MAG: hypothetical protein JWN99_1222 [Ilumatobacteraceae bacterium]|nr:hypothetical protein [Ilumatobacteraceae bacterium]
MIRYAPYAVRLTAVLVVALGPLVTIAACGSDDNTPTQNVPTNSNSGTGDGDTPVGGLTDTAFGTTAIVDNSSVGNVYTPANPAEPAP